MLWGATINEIRFFKYFPMNALKDLCKILTKISYLHALPPIKELWWIKMDSYETEVIL